MIIGLSGYMKSGKDTAGQIIVDLTTQKNYKLMEDEFGRPIPKLDGSGYWTKPDIPLFRIKKFAEKLKQVASLMTGIPVEKFEDQEFKESRMPTQWGDMTVRQFLQKLGTNAVRHHVHEDAWVISAMTEVQDEDHVVFTDCRFPNEAQAIKDRGGIIIRLNRYPPGCSPRFMDRTESEVSLDDWNFDYTIWNLGTVDDLRNQIKNILEKELAKSYAS